MEYFERSDWVRDFFSPTKLDIEKELLFRFRLFMNKLIGNYLNHFRNEVRQALNKVVFPPQFAVNMMFLVEIMVFPSSDIPEFAKNLIRKIGNVINDKPRETAQKFDPIRKEYERQTRVLLDVDPLLFSQESIENLRNTYEKEKDDFAEAVYRKIVKEFDEVIQNFMQFVAIQHSLGNRTHEEKDRMIGMTFGMILDGYLKMKKINIDETEVSSIDKMFDEILETAVEKSKLAIRLQKEIMEKPTIDDPPNSPPNALACPICLGVYSDRRGMMMLSPCQHSCCVNCIEEVSNLGECPSCRKKLEKAFKIFI